MKNTHYYCTYKKLLFLGLFFFLLTLDTKGFSQKLVSIPNTIELTFKSKINKTNYNLHIALPYGYEKSTVDYPTIYLLDANNDFPLVTSISRRLEAEDNLKKFVIVGISYKETPWIYRVTDYTPTKEKGRNNSGGAYNFAIVIKKEIIPLIEKHLRVKKKSRTIAGHSLGGVFGSYLLLNGSTMFDSYIISSPSMWWDDYYVLKNSKPPFLKSSIFISVGSLENPHMIESSKKLKAFIDNNLSASKRIIIFPNGENHASAKIRAYTDGLRWLFKEKKN
jgi:predicted alpha/beta superfamily hydrolase